MPRLTKLKPALVTCGLVKNDIYEKSVNGKSFLTETLITYCNICTHHTIIHKSSLNPCAESFVSKVNINLKSIMNNVSVKKTFVLNPFANSFVALSPPKLLLSTTTCSNILGLNPSVATFYPKQINKLFTAHTSHSSEPGLVQSSNNITLPTNLTLNPLATIFAPDIFCGINRISPESHIEITPDTILNELRVKNLNRIIVGHININSIRNKFEMLSTLVCDKVDILLISESKLNDTYPTAQFRINGFSSPFRMDRSEHAGGFYYIPGKISHLGNFRYNLMEKLNALQLK